MFTSGKTKQNLCWKRIETEMAQKGCNISAKKCCTKFQTLKRTYKQRITIINQGIPGKRGNISMYVVYCKILHNARNCLENKEITN